MRVVFMGTPDFATGTLEEIVKSGYDVVGVVTQPDKPKGRGKNLMPTPVKEVALKYSLPVYQPKRAKDPEVIVVAAFGQIITKEILEMPRFGCVNVHASLLPAYRGAAPIQWAVINGDKESGVTIMQMDEGIDTGDMMDKVIVPIAEDETGGSLFDKLSEAGAKLCVKVLRDLEEGKAVREKQPKESTTAYASMINKGMGEIKWERKAKEIEQLIRGLNPWPSAYTKIHGKMLKLWKADVLEDTAHKQTGEIVKIEKDGICVQTGEGLLKIRELQLEGKKRMDAASFLRGYSVSEGEILG